MMKIVLFSNPEVNNMLFNFFSKLKWIAIMALLLTIGLFSSSATPLFAHDGDNPSPDGLTPPPPPDLPPPSEQQILYRIDPLQSQAQYSVQEVYVGGIDGKLVVGQTSGIAGDVLIDWGDLANSQLGMVTVNVEQLTSDSKQRDRQIRKSYLESSLYPEATFIPEAEQTFPTDVVPGDTVSFVLHGYLTVHDVTILSDWTVELTGDADRLIGKATTDILMSEFGVGPISIVGLLKTEDEMQLTLDFVALPHGTASSVVNEPTIEVQPTSGETDLTFSDIRPILETKCVACHVDGEIGHTIYPMETVGDVVEYADDLALVIETGFMPPWLPSHHAPAFKNDRSLNEADKAALLEWIAAGAPNDVALDDPLENRAPAGQPLREDVVLTMPEPYIPAGDLTDDYRCFLLDPQLPNGGFVTASNVIPGDKRVVHHVILFQASGENRAEAEAKSAEDDRLGWECFGGPELSSQSPGAVGNSIGAWVPGSTPRFMPEGTGTYVEPGGLVAMQVHYNYEAGFYPDQTSAVLQVESADANLTPLRGIPLLAPVEIPCPADSPNEACDRAVSLAEKSESDQRLASTLFRICGKEIGDYAGESAENATSDCDWQAPIDGEVVTIGGHMHTLGTTQRVTLNPDSATPIILQDIPIWDFNLQGQYDLDEPIAVKKGDILRLTCTWDNTNGDPDDARYLTWGEGTNDEMCLNVVIIEPAEGFETIAGNELLMNSLARYPSWLPPSLGVQLIQSPSLVIGGLVVAVVALLALAALVLYKLNSRRSNDLVVS